MVDPDSDAAAHAAGCRRLSRSMPARWASRSTTRSSSMTGRACSRRRASGGCSASWARRRCSCSTAASTAGRREGRPVTASRRRSRPTCFDADFDAARVASLDDMRGIVDERRQPDRRCAAGRALRRRRSRAARGRARRPHAGRQKPAGVVACRATAACCRADELRRPFEDGRHRPRQAGRHLLRLRRHGGGHHAGAGNARPSATTGSMTARGPSGAAGPTRRW